MNQRRAGRRSDDDEADARRLAESVAGEPRLRAESTVAARLEKRPALALQEVLWPFIAFGYLCTASQSLPPQVAARAVSGWLHLYDSRLVGRSSNVTAPVDALPPEVRRCLPATCLALLGWACFKEALNGRDTSLWVAALKARLAVGGEVRQAEIPLSALHDLDLAMRIGVDAFTRAFAAKVEQGSGDSARVRRGLTLLAENWQSISTGQPSDLVELERVLSLVEPSIITDADLPSAVRVLALWARLSVDPTAVWPRLDYPSRVMAVYRAAAEQVPLAVPTIDEAHSLALVAEVIGAAPAYDPSVVKQTHRLLTQYIIDWGWIQPDSPDLSPLLPRCNVAQAGVRYCEGKPWQTETWCPRLRRVCTEAEGSHTSAKMAMPWWNWTLLELLSARQIPAQDAVSNNQPWPNAIGGWLNRWDDLRSRLRCSVCGSVMNPDYRYSARIDAAYAKTVMDCPTGLEGHDRGVYLNHCRGCHGPIDSRECPVRVEGYYLCVKCGTGPESVEPGSTCPSCGGTDLRPGQPTTCKSCQHRFHPPKF